MITYPTNRLLGVVDDPAAAEAIVRDLARAGFDGDAVEVLVGEAGRGRLARLGARPGPLSRLVRVFQFMTSRNSKVVGHRRDHEPCVKYLRSFIVSDKYVYRAAYFSNKLTTSHKPCSSQAHVVCKRLFLFV